MTKLFAAIGALALAALGTAAYMFFRKSDSKKQDMFTLRSYWTRANEKVQAFGTYLKKLFTSEPADKEAVAA